MKYFAAFFLLWSGFFGTSAGWAEESPADDTYLATVGSDGVQHVRLLEVMQ